MAITSAVCTSFKVELLKGVHNFTASSGDTFNLALYTSSASLGAATTAYTTSEEVSGSGYTAKGNALTSVTPVASKDAELVNKANLKVCPPDELKLCLPCKSSCLKLEAIADVIAII